MIDIMKDMSSLREKADTENLRLKHDKKLISLEQERDWFRSESMRLSKLYKEQTVILDRVKVKFHSA